MIRSAFSAASTLDVPDRRFGQSLELPLSQHLFAPKDEHLKRVGGETNLAMAPGRLEKAKPAPNLDMRRLLRKVAMLIHPHVSCSSEQAKDNGPTYVSRQLIIGLTKSVSVPFLPTAFFERQAA